MKHKLDPKWAFEQGCFLSLNNFKSIIKYKFKTSEFESQNEQSEWSKEQVK